MIGQTRCELALVLYAGRTYAVPRDSRVMPDDLQRGFDDAPTEYLDVVIDAGTIVSGATVRGSALLACDMYGVRVLVPREVLEDVN
jgi:hypothetical protein